MRKVFLLLVLLSLVGNVYAQDVETRNSMSGNTWAIKGKVLPWIFVGSGINYTLGAEYGFNKVHAIGIDLVYNDKSMGHEVYDTTKKEYVSGPRMYTVSRGLFINYRRYLDLSKTCIYHPVSKLLNNDFLSYVSLFARYGKTDYHYQAGYETSQVSYDEWQYSGGLLFGVVSGVLDINMGPFYKQRYITDIENEHHTQAIHRSMQSGIGFRVGVNLFFVMKKKGTHYLSRYAMAQ